MLETLSQNIIYGKTHYVCEHLDIQGKQGISITQIREQKGELTIENTAAVSQIEEVKQQLPKVKTAQLIINNTQVLQKEVSIANQVSDTVLVNLAFSNIDLKVFYYEVIKFSTKAFVFICRKAYIDAIIEAYKKDQIYVSHWSLGIVPFVSLLPILDSDTEIQTFKRSLQITNGEIHSIATISSDHKRYKNYNISGLEVNNEHINGLGAIIGKLGNVDPEVVLRNYEELQTEKQSLFKQHRYFELGLPTAIAVLMLIFLVNFLFYNHYYKEVENLSEIGNTNSLQKELLVTKDSIVTKKQKLFEDVIESSSSASSYYIDALMLQLPPSIKLEKLEYHPLLKSIKNNKAVSIENRRIVIAGFTNKNEDLSNWISSIEKIEFVNKVSIKSLDKNDRNTNFSIDLEMNIANGY